MRNNKFARLLAVLFFLGAATLTANAQAPAPAGAPPAAGAPAATAPISEAAEPHAAEAAEGAEHEEKPNAFTPHTGTIFHPLVQRIFGQKPPEAEKEDGSIYKEGEKRGPEVHFSNVKYDYLFMSFLLMTILAIVGVSAGKKAQIRPDGKPNTLAKGFEAAAEGFQEYLVGVMGKDLAMKYAPMLGSFFFTILLFNWIGLIPGLASPTANPNVPFALAFVSFFMVHIIAIKEAGFKSWFMHLVGEPLWMAPLMFPLHIVGELVKPLSLALRLLGNVFGEEIVLAKLAALALLVAAGLGLPTFIPLQFPIMIMSVFFGLLQALVFSTLLAIYIAILGTSHDDHDDHGHHGHVEHIRLHGHADTVAHGTEATLA